MHCFDWRLAISNRFVDQRSASLGTAMWHCVRVAEFANKILAQHNDRPQNATDFNSFWQAECDEILLIELLNSKRSGTSNANLLGSEPSAESHGRLPLSCHATYSANSLLKLLKPRWFPKECALHESFTRNPLHLSSFSEILSPFFRHFFVFRIINFA